MQALLLLLLEEDELVRVHTCPTWDELLPDDVPPPPEDVVAVDEFPPPEEVLLVGTQSR